MISEAIRALMARLLLERLSLRGICRAVGVGLKWLLGFLVHCFEAWPDHLHVQPVTCDGDVMVRRLEVEADDMASFVQQKTHKPWIWKAMNAATRQVMAFHVGDAAAPVPSDCGRRFLDLSQICFFRDFEGGKSLNF